MLGTLDGESVLWGTGSAILNEVNQIWGSSSTSQDSPVVGGAATAVYDLVPTASSSSNLIVPYISVAGVWSAAGVSSVTVASGTAVSLGPQAWTGGTWSWTGPNGFTSTSREIDNIPLPSTTNTYTATYTAGGTSYKQAFIITVGGCSTVNPIVPNISVAGVWSASAISSVTVASGTAVDLGPQPMTGGTWAWTGPNGFTSTAREIDYIALSPGVNTYTATYTVNGCSYKQAFTISD